MPKKKWSGPSIRKTLGTAPDSTYLSRFSSRVHYSQEPSSVSYVAVTAAPVPYSKAPALDRVDFLHRDAWDSPVVIENPTDLLDGFHNEEFILSVGEFLKQRSKTGSPLQQLASVYMPLAVSKIHSEHRDVLDRRDFCLLAVHGAFHSAFEEFDKPIPDTLCGMSRVAKDGYVIRVSNEAEPPTCNLLVQLIQVYHSC